MDGLSRLLLSAARVRRRVRLGRRGLGVPSELRRLARACGGGPAHLSVGGVAATVLAKEGLDGEEKQTMGKLTKEEKEKEGEKEENANHTL